MRQTNIIGSYQRQMTTTHIITDISDKNDTDQLATHPLQSLAWGEARHAEKKTVIRCIEQENETAIASFQMTLHPVPHTPFSIGYIPRSLLPSKTVIDALITFGKKNHVISILLEPNLPFDQAKKAGFLDLHPAVKIANHPLFPEWTQVLDINPSEEQLLTNLKPKTRYNIRLAEKKGVTVQEESNEKGLNTFLDLFFETCARQGYHGHTRAYHTNIWNHLSASQAHIFIAYYDNIPLAAYELFFYHDTLYYPYGGSSLLHRNVMAANLLMWEAIRFGKRMGAKQFDLWGSLPPNQALSDNPWAGFTRFKEGYGATYQQMIGSFDIVINQPLYQLYNIADKIRRRIM